jgi:hypothetical protein
MEGEVPLHSDLLNDYVAHNLFDEGDDEYVSDYIDLILFAIITQVERYKAYSLNPTTALMDEIRAHEAYITNAESSLNVHIVRIIHNFKNTIRYDTYMSSPTCRHMPGEHAILGLKELPHRVVLSSGD